MSLKMKLVYRMVKLMGGNMFTGGQIDVEKCRAVLAKAYSKHQVEKGVKMTVDVMNGVEVALFTPENCQNQDIVYYVHGGGLVTGDRFTAGPYSSQLALATGSKVVACTYRLAPENPFPASLDDVYAVYQALHEKYPQSRIHVTGESGGAYLSLALALKCKQENCFMPASLVLNSVVADMSGKVIERHDSPRETTVSVSGLESLSKMYAAEKAWTDPLVSCIYGDFQGLPPMRIVYDRDEVLAADSKAVIRKAREAGITVEAEEYVGCFHAFTTTGKGTPESARELRLTAAFMHSCAD